MRVIKITNNRVTETKQILSNYILQEGEMYSETGEIGQVYNPETGEFTDYVPTQEEMYLQRIEQIKTEIKQVSYDIQDYTLLEDTVKVEELQSQKQDLIDEYNTLK